MNTEDDATPIVRSWLRAEPDASAKPIVDDVLAMLDTNTQSASRPPLWRVADPRSQTALLLAAAAVVVVALVGIGLGPLSGVGTGSPAPSSSGASPSGSPTSPPKTNTVYTDVAPGAYDVPWDGGRITLTMPAGWQLATAGWPDCWDAYCQLPQGGTTLTKYPLERGGRTAGPIVNISLVHDPSDVQLFNCVAIPGRKSPVGPRVADLVDALERQISDHPALAPTQVRVSGFPATRFVLTDGPCVSTGGYSIWLNASTYGFSIPQTAEGTVYIIDANGQRLVITSTVREATVDDLAELDGLIGSIEIEPSDSPSVPVTTVFAPGFLQSKGRHGLTVAGVPMSIDNSNDSGDVVGWGVPSPFYIGRSIFGPQGAEAAILFASFPDSTLPRRCMQTLPLGIGTTAADLARAMVTAPRDPLAFQSPVETSVGGRPALYLEFTADAEEGCRGGYFYSWADLYGGALWGGVGRGDVVRVWIVEVNETILVVEGLSTPGATPELLAELQWYIDSIRFE